MIRLLLLSAVFTAHALDPGDDISIRRLAEVPGFPAYSSGAFVASRSSNRWILFPKRQPRGRCSRRRRAYREVEPVPIPPAVTNTTTREVHSDRGRPHERILEGGHPGTAVGAGSLSVPRSAAARAYLERKRAERLAEAGRGRETCTRCHRPRKVCLCSVLPGEVISTSTRFVILQHPSEAKRQITGTVPIVLLCLSNCRRIVMPHTEDPQLDDDGLKRLLGIEGRTGSGPCARATRPLLLFPCPEAEFLEDIASERHENEAKAEEAAAKGAAASCNLPSAAAEETSREGFSPSSSPSSPAVVVLIDGTWSQARQILSRYPSLSSRRPSAVGPGARGVRSPVVFSAEPRRGVDVEGAPHLGEVMEDDALCRAVMFRSAGPSGYGFRREPSRECVSTLESVAYSLEVLERTPEGLSAAQYLRRSFSAMVSTQLEARGDAKTPRFENRKAKTRHRRSMHAASCSDRGVDLGS